MFRFKASKKADGVLLGAKDKTIDLPTDLNRGSDCTSFFIRANEKFRMVYKHTAAEHVLTRLHFQMGIGTLSLSAVRMRSRCV